MTEKGSVYREGIVGNELGCTEKDLQRSRLIDGENLIWEKSVNETLRRKEQIMRYSVSQKMKWK